MKLSRIAFILLVFGCCAPFARAAGDRLSTHFISSNVVDAPSFELATETAYMVGIIGNPNSYDVAAQFFTARWRWGGIERDSWLQGYQQVYALFMAEPITRGPENFYYGISVGLRYVFQKPGARFGLYVSGGVGLGWLDSHANVLGAQGQDFTFNILSAVGVCYQVNDHWKLTGGLVYQHLSNGGQTDPNPSLNLTGPQVGATYSF
jgi:hypothetical protein